MTIKALLYDLDGVLVDAMAWHEEAFLAAIRESGYVLSAQEHQKTYAGLPTRKKLQMLVDTGAIPATAVERIARNKQALTKTYIELHATCDPQRIYLLQHFETAGYKQGCVTNCIKDTTMDVLRRTGLLPFVSLGLITNEDVHDPKPSPEPYQRACGLLGVQPEEVVVFEDHAVGMAAAFNAGCHATQIHEYRELTVGRVWDAIQEAGQSREGLHV